MVESDAVPQLPSRRGQLPVCLRMGQDRRRSGSQPLEWLGRTTSTGGSQSLELGVSITGIPLDPAWQVGRGNGRNQLVAVRLFGLADCNGLVDISTDVDLLHAPSVL